MSSLFVIASALNVWLSRTLLLLSLTYVTWRSLYFNKKSTHNAAKLLFELSPSLSTLTLLTLRSSISLSLCSWLCFCCYWGSRLLDDLDSSEVNIFSLCRLFALDCHCSGFGLSLPGNKPAFSCITSSQFSKPLSTLSISSASRRLFYTSLLLLLLWSTRAPNTNAWIKLTSKCEITLLSIIVYPLSCFAEKSRALRSSACFLYNPASYTFLAVIYLLCFAFKLSTTVACYCLYCFSVDN